MTGAITMEKVTRPELAKHESSILDLVFVMDCTGSMGSYIASATDNIRSIVEEIVVSEKSDIRLALVEYRDHPPQDPTFVTRVHDFTAKVSEMKGWLQQCQADGGGDGPEAVADGLHAILKLSWRAESTKICILIADAPPHGLDPNGDGFPNGCPCSLDPVQIVREMAEKHITLYSVGVEPSITPYREFFMSLAYTTGGQYVPMINAKLLAKVIIGGVREEISLDRLMQVAEEDINREMERAEAEGVDDKEKVKRINNIFATKNLFSTQMTNTFGMTSTAAKAYSSTCQTMGEMQSAFGFGMPWKTEPAATSTLFGSSTSSTTAPFGSFASGAPLETSSASTSCGFTFGAPSTATSVFSTVSTTAPPSTFSSPSTATFGSFGFGMSSETVPTATSTLFGSGTSSTTASFGSFASGAPLGTSSASTSSGFTFGSPSTTTSGSFGMSSETGLAATSTLFGSGKPATTASGTAPFGSFTFGAPLGTASASTSSVFGFSSSSTTTSGSFGMSSETEPAVTSTLFESGTSSNTVFGTAPFAFATSTESFGENGAALATEKEANINYDVTENVAVNEDQAERIYQKWQHRKK